MTRDLETLQMWILFCLIFAAVTSTAFPVLYLLSPWYKYPVGRALMVQAGAFALALDLTVLFQFWQPEDILIVFWVNAFAFTYIALASAWLTWHMFKYNFIVPLQHQHKENKDNDRVYPGARGLEDSPSSE